MDRLVLSAHNQRPKRDQGKVSTPVSIKSHYSYLTDTAHLRIGSFQINDNKSHNLTPKSPFLPISGLAWTICSTNH
jgi:hypothetical protein